MYSRARDTGLPSVNSSRGNGADCSVVAAAAAIQRARQRAAATPQHRAECLDPLTCGAVGNSCPRFPVRLRNGPSCACYQRSGRVGMNAASRSAMSWWSRADGCQWQPR